MKYVYLAQFKDNDLYEIPFTIGIFESAFEAKESILESSELKHNGGILQICYNEGINIIEYNIVNKEGETVGRAWVEEVKISYSSNE